MRFLVGAQLPPSLARWLSAKGHEADLDMQRSSDPAIWDYALASGATIVTKDEDFAQRKVLSGDGPIVIWIRLPNTSRQALFAWFERVWPDLLMAVERGESLIEVI